MRARLVIGTAWAAALLCVGSTASDGFEPVAPAELARFMECALYSDARAVPRARRSGGVGFVAEPKPPASSPSTQGPTLPFDAGPELRGRAGWTSRQDDGGWFVAKDAGEWGGGLWWVEGPGRATPVIENLSVFGVVRVSTQRIAIGRGLHRDHGESGVAVLLDRLAHAWLPRAALWFDGVPQVYSADSPDGVFIVTADSVLRLSDVDVTTVARALAPFYRLRPLAVSVDRSDVFIGMSLLGLRIPKSGGPSRWYRPGNCRSFAFVERELTLAGLTGTVRRCECGR